MNRNRAPEIEIYRYYNCTAIVQCLPTGQITKIISRLSFQILSKFKIAPTHTRSNIYWSLMKKYRMRKLINFCRRSSIPQLLIKTIHVQFLLFLHLSSRNSCPSFGLAGITQKMEENFWKCSKCIWNIKIKKLFTVLKDCNSSLAVLCNSLLTHRLWRRFKIPWRHQQMEIYIISENSKGSISLWNVRLSIQVLFIFCGRLWVLDARWGGIYKQVMIK